MISIIWIACPPPPNRLVHVLHCMSYLALAALGKSPLLLYAEGGGPYLFNAQAGRYLYCIRIGAANAVLTVNYRTGTSQKYTYRHFIDICSPLFILDSSAKWGWQKILQKSMSSNELPPMAIRITRETLWFDRTNSLLLSQSLLVRHKAYLRNKYFLKLIFREKIFF
jgi:hypothetical protein